jgi:hypothetical protein
MENMVLFQNLDGDNEVVSIFDSKDHSKNIRMTLWD